MINILNEKINFNGARLKGEWVSIKTCPVCNKENKLGIRISNGWVKCWVCGDSLNGFLTRENLNELKKVVNYNSDSVKGDKVLDIYNPEFNLVYRDSNQELKEVYDIEDMLYYGPYYHPEVYSLGLESFKSYLVSRGISSDNPLFSYFNNNLIKMVQPYDENEDEVGLLIGNSCFEKVGGIYIYKTSNHEELKENKKIRKHWMKGSVVSPLMFGNFNAKTMLIFEGLEDAFSYVDIKILTEENFNYRDYIFCITFSSSNFNKIKLGELESVTEYRFCLDNDEASNKAYKNIYNVYDDVKDYINYTLTVEYPEENSKDFNDMLNGYDFSYEEDIEEEDISIGELLEDVKYSFDRLETLIYKQLEELKEVTPEETHSKISRMSFREVSSSNIHVVYWGDKPYKLHILTSDSIYTITEKHKDFEYLCRKMGIDYTYDRFYD